MGDTALTFLLGKPRRTEFKKTDSGESLMLVDATMDISSTYESDVTEHPVEDGPDITDHIRPKPVTISVEGVISESPINLEAQLAGIASGAGNLLGKKYLGGFGAFAGSFAGTKAAGKLFAQKPGSPAQIARDTLEDMVTKKQLFTIVDKYRVYDNMAITNLTFPRNQTTGQKLQFKLTAKRIYKVSAETTEIKKIASVAHSAAKKQNLGTQIPATIAAPPESIFKKATNFLGITSLGSGIK